MSVKQFKPLPAQPAPIMTAGPIAWVRDNLFSSTFNIIATILIIGSLVAVLPGMIDWLFISANWSGTSQSDCVKDGACWVFISAWSQQIFYGSYPTDELWRVNLCLFLLAGVIALSFILPDRLRNKVAVPAFLLLPFIGLLFLDGSMIGLPQVTTNLWGGFSLNVLLAAASIIIAFPFGFLWALGRRSDMPFARSVSVTCIEFFRGTPILALFFMGSVMLPLFFPADVNVDKLLRVWIILVLFMSAYMAEVFRSGFQAIPSGQYEAADSIGLGYWQKTLLIIFPQVIKVSMPNILATFVMVFKNTVFLLVIAVPEMLQVIMSALSNSNWLGGHAIEGYLFVAFIFWACCFSMSLLATSIEKKLDTSHNK
ncbi:amino acid ABC transporter permease [Alkalimarinus alittae]|uniref:Amino acid ABC transporter permease n=1 Tax=Alkalimarinus alittae TaxID=2961619 RepID=A0ABY6N1T6_9ALTE|nr:amino acid ABC transporter permease [Alkalimarinus alittae]UZE95972.1 amino acid ABC transporter permease [Alkalimarinus alittae]